MTALPEDSLDVLYIGDDADLAEIYRLKLELDGYLVRIVQRDGEWPEASWRPDIAYIDVRDGDGVGARGHRRLRADAALRNVPAVILTTLLPDQLAERGVVLGQMDYPVNVVVPFQLTQAVEIWSTEPERPRGRYPARRSGSPAPPAA